MEVRFGDVFGYGPRKRLSEIPNIKDLMDEVFTVLGAEEFDGKYGKYWIIYTDKGEFKTSSTVVGQQAMRIDQYIKQTPDVTGVRVKLVKVKNYMKFDDPGY